MSSPDNSRREFLQAGIAGTAALALAGNETRADDTPSPASRSGRSATPA